MLVDALESLTWGTHREPVFAAPGWISLEHMALRHDEPEGCAWRPKILPSIERHIEAVEATSGGRQRPVVTGCFRWGERTVVRIGAVWWDAMAIGYLCPAWVEVGLVNGVPVMIGGTVAEAPASFVLMPVMLKEVSAEAVALNWELEHRPPSAVDPGR